MWSLSSPLVDCEENPGDPSCIPSLSPGQPANANQSVSSSIISSSPPRPIPVGPSHLTGSPITGRIEGNVNATSIPSSNGLFLGSTER